MTDLEREVTTWHSNYFTWMIMPVTGLLVYIFSMYFVIDVLSHPVTTDTASVALTVWLPYLFIGVLTAYLLISFLIPVIRIPLRIGVAKQGLHLIYLFRPPQKIPLEEIKRVEVDRNRLIMRIRRAGRKELRVIAGRRVLERVEMDIRRLSGR